MIITGMIPQIGFADRDGRGVALAQHQVFDYSQFAEPLRDEIRRNAERLAEENDLEIDFIRRRSFRKDEQIQKILQTAP